MANNNTAYNNLYLIFTLNFLIPNNIHIKTRYKYNIFRLYKKEMLYLCTTFLQNVVLINP